MYNTYKLKSISLFCNICEFKHQNFSVQYVNYFFILRLAKYYF